MIDPNNHQLQAMTPATPLSRFRVVHAGGSMEIRAHYCLSPRSRLNPDAKWKFEVLSDQTMQAEYVAVFDAGRIGVLWEGALRALLPGQDDFPTGIKPQLNLTRTC